MDGISQWKSILYGQESRRRNLLHNIDDRAGYAALRQGNFKLVKGTTYEGNWDNWFGPSGRENGTSFNEQLYKQQVSASKNIITIAFKNTFNLFL